MKILFANNYPTGVLLRESRENRFPAHHVWGVTEFQSHGLDVICLDPTRWPGLDRLGRKARLGRWLDQQVRAFVLQNRYDVYYSANADTALLLAQWRNAGLFRRPIVSLFHHPLPQTPGMQRALAGHDKVICLSRKLQEILEDQFKFRPGQIETVAWGIDDVFFDARRRTRAPSLGYFLSAGKSGRDFETLSRAFEGLDSNLKIFCSGKAAPKTARPNVQVSFADQEQCDGNLSFDQLSREYESARAVCIPLVVPENLQVSMIGLTSILDAMVFAKPIVMTRNPLVEIDIEKERIGLWIENGDVAGWRRAIQYLTANPTEAAAMGARARKLCEERYTLAQFSRAMETILRNAAKAHERSPQPLCVEPADAHRTRS